MVFLSPVNAITITYGAVTQTLQAWGFTYCTLHLRNRAPSTLILDTAGGDPALNASIPYGGRITVAFALGDGTTWYFQGTRRRFNAQAHAEAPMTSLQFEDVWSDLMLTIFQHYWSMLGADNLLHNTYFSRLNLFQDISAGPDSAWVYLTADNQLRQIIDFASEQ